MNGPVLPRIIAAAALALALGSLAYYLRDRNERRPAERFVATFDVSARRPAEVATLELVPAADLAANVVADIALSDAFGVYQLEEASPELRARWLRAVESIDDELLAAREIAIDAAARRPGWALHWSMLGRLNYTWQRRHPLATASTELSQWYAPLRIGFLYGPGSDGTAAAFATATLERWPELPASARRESGPLFTRALVDPELASAALPMILEAVGRDEALALLPREPPTLRAAFGTLAQRNDIAGAVALYRLWEAAEWQARVRGIETLEERARLHDVEGLRRMSIDWMVAHPASDFDTPAGRRQLLRVLQLTMNDREGHWQRDARGGVLRFLLDHRMSPGRSPGSGIETVAGGAAVGEAMSALEAVPDPIRARARLLAGDVFGAESLLQRSDSAGSLEWTPFLLDLARFRIAQNMPDSAQTALDTLARAARNECEVVLVRRQLERLRAASPPQSLPAPEELPESLSWSNDGQLSVCIDPDTAPRSFLATTIEAPAPALVSYGWNGGRRASISVPAGRVRVSVPLAGQWGRNAFFLRTLAGGPARPIGATIERR
jgi:hypothetical protein